MKKFMLFLLLLAGANLLYGEVKVVQVERSFHKHSAGYGKGVYYQLSNPGGQYMVYFQWINATPQKPGSVVIGIPEPNFWYGFIARDFMSLEINGINSRSLEPKEFKTFTEEGRGGLDVRYNFDGVQMTLRFSMLEKSPLLYISWIKNESEEEIKSAKISMSAYPSYTVKNNGKPDDSYQREIETGSRKLNSGTGKRTWHFLNNQDKYLCMYDNFYQPSATDANSQGPCLLLLDWNNLKSGKVHFGNIYGAFIELTPKTDFTELNLAILEFKKPMPNSEFFDYLKANPEFFGMEVDKK